MTTTKTARIAAGAVLALLLTLAAGWAALTVAPGTAHAKLASDYTYTVRVWGGNQGKVSSDGETYGEVAEITGVKWGTDLSLSNKFKVQIENDKYYVKGFRLGGTDNQNTDGTSNLRDNIYVTEDLDYVVSYGVKGDQVSYTLHFVEYQTGKVLADPVTYYGNNGDKPVASFQYITGYRPRYRNITGELKKDGTNDWTFEYIKLAEGETESGRTTTETTTGGGAATGGGTAAGGGAAAGGGGAAAGGAAAGGAAAGGAAAGGAAAGGAAAGGAAAGAGAGGEGDEGEGAEGGAVAGGEGAEGGAAADAEAANATPATEEILDLENPQASGLEDDAKSSDASADKKDAKDEKANDKPEKSEPETVTVEANPGGVSVPVVIGIAALVIALAAGIMYFFMRRNNAEEDLLPIPPSSDQ